MSLPTVALVLYPQFSLFHVSIPHLVFTSSPPGKPLFDLKIASVGGRLQHADLALTTMQPDGGLELLETADVVVVPGWYDLSEPPEPELAAALHHAHTRGATVVGLCYGAYALAYAGLLDGRAASTHWAAEQDFSQRFPAVKLNTNALYVDQDRLITSAGTGAGLDCCLYIVRAYYGTKVANKVARILVVPPHREGGQAQFIEQPVASSTQDADINHLLDYLRKNLHQPHNIDDLADRIFMSRRTFTRHFSKATGTTFGKWLVNERLQRSLELLESTSLAVEKVAELAGFQTAASFRQHFNQRYQVSPSAWRKTFNGSAQTHETPAEL